MNPKGALVPQCRGHRRRLQSPLLAPICHSRKLPLGFPFFLLIPRDLRVVTIVRISDQGSFLLCRAGGHAYHERTQQNRDDNCSKITDLCQHKLRCLRVAFERRAPNYL